jgi:CHAT domain-containing protein
VLFDRAYRTYVQGHLVESLEQTRSGYQRFAASSPEWATKFQVLEVEILVFSGKSQEALEVLRRLPPHLPEDLAINALTLKGVAQGRLHQFDEAETSVAEAQRRCVSNPLPNCGTVERAEGFLAVQRGDFAQAADHFRRSLDFAAVHNDKYLEVTALLNLGLCATNLRHFDEAIDWLHRTRQAASDQDAGLASTKALGNLGWAYYNLGDLDQSLALTLQAQKKAIELGATYDEIPWEMNAGQVYAARGEFDRAGQSFQQALSSAQKLEAQEDIFSALTVLAALNVQTGNFTQANHFAEEAFAIAHAAKNRADELDTLLIQATVAARSRDAAKATSALNALIHDQAADDSLKWEAEYALARMYEDLGQWKPAEQSYNQALSNFERARSRISSDDLRLPFLTNASNIYEDYVEFLVSRGRGSEALSVADYSRAQTLAEGLGLLKANATAGRTQLDARSLARRQHGTILFYSLGTKKSHLWVITDHEIRLLSLPPANAIDQQIQQYRKLLAGPRVELTANNTALFDTLIAPALPLLQPDARVVIIPDGSLNTLNFETLQVSSPAPHYWIEDATVVYANSLHMLSGQLTRSEIPSHELLLMGDAVLPANDYSRLPHAAVEMQTVGKHFDTSAEKVLAREQATPAAYVSSHPEDFAYLHFVTHGTANRLSPLDSAVILSRSDRQDESYKLYARTILQHPLRAELVTISSCYGSGSRTYSGEGLVGLSWAFLRAGAHHVIGALWEVSDDSTPQLMDVLYGELGKGKSPEEALRTAKLSLLHSDSVFRKPFYWGPFQLYVRS